MSYFRSNIDAMSGYVPGEQPQTDGFIKLNTNENPYPPSPAVATAVNEVLQRGLRKYPDPMAGVFRCRASELLGVPPDWILAGNGSDDILTIVTRALVGEGDLLRMPYPSYILYRTLAELQGARCEEILFQRDWSLPTAFAEGGKDLKLVFLANPNSPSGTLVPPERVLELAAQLPCPILVDEAYADFAETNCLQLVAKNERIMVSRSFSKSHALAGLRFGYLVAQPHLIEHVARRYIQLAEPLPGSRHHRSPADDHARDPDHAASADQACANDHRRVVQLERACLVTSAVVHCILPGVVGDPDRSRR